ncbi:hypothetical protein CCR75_000573 [Bremia lactucae]|uniref:Strictosidine synthase conserved region domain-containing protein n=1 Tax=Bremia lactucae TaxID=4779 RepID=A0A976IJB1_BRELC|nr:hypothetical protein CCR75_000573 [Bremia lactucae]
MVFMSLRNYLSRELLAACFFVMLLSSTLDQYPGEVDPLPYNCDYELHTREQEARYDKTQQLIRNTKLFEPPQIERLFLDQALGAEDMAVSQDGIAYVGLTDGRIASFDAAANRLGNFSRTGRHVPGCGASDMEGICGRPLGLIFASATPFSTFMNRIPSSKPFPGDQVLLVADAYKGVFLFDANGKRTLLFSRTKEEKLNYFNGIAVVHATGEVYVSASSQRFQRNQTVLDFLERNPTGSLVHFDPRTKQVRIVAKNLGYPNGLTLDQKRLGLLVALSFQSKIVRFDFLTKQMTDFAFLPGDPDNISIEKIGLGTKEKEVLMVAMVSHNDGSIIHQMRESVKVRKLLSLLPTWVTMSLVHKVGFFASVDLDTGDINFVYEASQGQTPMVSGVRRFGDHIYLLSWARSYLTRIPAALLQ